jgi:RNA polymerase sigma-70 factor (ECF subfamily)
MQALEWGSVVAAQEVEDQIRRLCRAGDYQTAATLLLERYGSEILSLLCSRLRNDGNGRDVFGMFCEDLWRALPGFEFRCSSRTWAYVLARHAELRFRAEPQRRPDRNLPLLDEVQQLVAGVRTSTSPYRRTQVQQRLRALRRRLAEQDELILLLRVDRALSWREIAHVFLPPNGAADDGAVQREAARLRQRYQAIKQRLRDWAEQEGLLPSSLRDAEMSQTGLERAPLSVE